MAAEGDRFGELLEHRRWLDSCKQSASRDRDKTTLAIAGGSLAISVGFLEKVVPFTGQPWDLLLFIAWTCEIAAMVAVLWSMRTSEAAFEAEIYRTDLMLRTPGHENPGWPNPSLEKTEALNHQAPIVAVVGLIFMLVHAGLALSSFSFKENARVKVTEHHADSHASSSDHRRTDAVSPAAGTSAANQEVID